LQYNDILPDDAPSWMTSEYDIWFRNHRLLVHHILSNPDFDGKIDYAPVQEYIGFRVSCQATGVGSKW
jgi:hypothetical protein